VRQPQDMQTFLNIFPSRL